MAPCVPDIQRRGHSISHWQPQAWSSGLLIPSKGFGSSCSTSLLGREWLSRALGFPPRTRASKQRCQKETLNRNQYPLVSYTGKRDFGIFLVSQCGQTQGQNQVQLIIMKLKLMHPTLFLASQFPLYFFFFFFGLFGYFAVYIIIRLEIYHTSWARIHHKCARIKYRWRFNYHATHAF